MAFVYRDMNVLLEMPVVHSYAVVAGFEGVEIVTRSGYNSRFLYLALGRRGAPSDSSVELLFLYLNSKTYSARQLTQESK